MLVYGFVRDHEEDGKEAFVIEESKCNNKKFFELIDKGFKLELNNNYESIKYAYEVLGVGYVDEKLEEQRAYKNCCSICQRYEDVNRATGQRYHFGHEKWVVFNGYVDDQCADSNLRNVTWKH